MRKTYNHSIGEVAKDSLFPVQYQGRYWTLRKIEGSKKTFDDFKIHGVGFSAIGHELFTVVDRIETLEYTDKLKKFFHSQGLQMLELTISG